MNEKDAAMAEERICVLHIDDEESFLELFRTRIKKSGENIDIISISDPSECLDELEENEVDCIVSDFQYPDTTGLGLFNQVRAEYPDIPFVILTGQGSEKVASRAISEGVTDYFLKDEIVKKHDILVRRIRNMVERYRSQREKRRILERGSDGYFGLDKDWNFTYVDTKAAQDILGKPREDLLGRNIWDLYGSLVGTVFEDRYREAMNKEKALTFEAKHPSQDAWYSLSVYPTQNGISVYIQDLTILKKRQDKLDRKIDQQKAIADLSRYAMEEHGLENLMSEASRRVKEALDSDYTKILELDQSKDELLLVEGAGWDEDKIGDVKISISDAKGSQAGYTLSKEEPVVMKDLESEKRFSGSALFDSGDVRSGISTIIGDIDNPWGILGTHSIEPKNYTENDVKFVQTIANILAEAIEEERRKKELEESRKKYRTLIQNFPHGTVSLYDKDLRYQVIGGKILEEMDVNPEDLKGEKVSEAAPDKVADEKVSEFESVLEGNEREFELDYNDKKLHFWSYPLTDDNGDVFAGLSMSRDVGYIRDKEEESELRREALDTIKDGVYILDDDRRFIFVNKAYCDVVGREKEEIEGKKSTLDSTEEAMNEIDEMQQSMDEDEVGNVEIKINGSDGDSVPVEIRFSKFSGRNIEDGRVGVVREITDRKEREEMLEEFGSLVSHDLRNPLNLAKGHLDLARESGQEDDLEVVQKAHNRMESIIDELMLITMQQDRIRKIDVDVQSAFEEAFYFAGGNDMSYNVDEDLTVRAERSGLISMFENLVSNSREHNDGQVRLKVGSLHEENGFYYEDDGEGIDNSIRPQIFQYGSTTSSKGRGLGMPIVKHIAELNGWEVSLCESESGGFRIEFT